MSVTHTRTHTYVTFANPHLVCTECGQRAIGFHTAVKCGCDSGSYLMPCGDAAFAESTCPSWSPMDGCLCKEVLGSVSHPPVG